MSIVPETVGVGLLSSRLGRCFGCRRDVDEWCVQHKLKQRLKVSSCSGRGVLFQENNHAIHAMINGVRETQRRHIKHIHYCAANATNARVVKVFDHIWLFIECTNETSLHPAAHPEAFGCNTVAATGSGEAGPSGVLWDWKFCTQRPLLTGAVVPGLGHWKEYLLTPAGYANFDGKDFLPTAARLARNRIIIIGRARGLWILLIYLTTGEMHYLVRGVERQEVQG